MTLHDIVGPRVPSRALARDPARYFLPAALLGLAALLLLVSLGMPYWQLTLHAPQYPKGLHVHAYLNRLTGDVHEIDGLNHYIGMRPLEEAAQLERTLAVSAVTVVALLVAAGIFIHTRFAAYLAVPAALFPGLFLADLHFWLSRFGSHLDPHAPLSSAVKPFVPPVLGNGFVGQFRTTALPDAGLWLALAASLAIAAGLFFHRRAFKPLVDAEQGGARRGVL